MLLPQVEITQFSRGGSFQMKVIMMLGLLDEVRVITLKYYYSDNLSVCDLESYLTITTGTMEDCTA